MSASTSTRIAQRRLINHAFYHISAVVYLIDSTNIQKLIKYVAEYLYNLMTDACLAKNRTPFLILCNKQDLPNAKTAVAIEKMLETEL